MRTACYMRVSTTDQTLDRQRNLLAPFNAVEYYDEGASRHQTDRKYFQLLIKHCQEGRYDKVVVTEPDRFGTGDSLEFSYYAFLLRKAGVQLVTVSGQVLNGIDEGSVLMSAVASLTSRREQLVKSERSTSARARDMLLFKYCGGHVAPGLDVVAMAGDVEKYRIQFGPMTWTKIRNGVEEVFDAMPAKEPGVTLYARPGSRSWMVIEVFRRYADLGQSPQKIADWINTEKVPGFVRYPVNKMTIHQMLGNSAYIGLPVANKRRGGDFTEWRDGKVQEVESGTTKPESSWIVPESPLYEMVPIDLWERAQKRRKDRSNGRTHPKGDDSLWLRGMVYCGNCGRQMRQSRGGRRVPGYACASYLDQTHVTNCRHYHVRHSELVERAQKWLEESQNTLQRLQPVDGKAFEIFMQACEIGNQMEVGMPYGEYIEKQIAECSGILAEKEAELDQKLEAYGTLPEALRSRAHASLTKLQSEIEDLRERTKDLRKPLEDLFTQYADIQAKIDAAAHELTLESLRRVVDRIVVHHEDEGKSRSKLVRVEFLTLSAPGLDKRWARILPRCA